jgi:hypothetical protein
MRDLFIDISRVEVLVDMVKAASTNINQLIELQTEIGAYGYYLAEHCGVDTPKRNKQRLITDVSKCY